MYILSANKHWLNRNCSCVFGYATLTLCCDDVSMQGENVIQIALIDDAVRY